MIRNLWLALWPNMVAPSVWTIIAIVIAHFKAKWHRDRLHNEHLAVVAKGNLDLLDLAQEHHDEAMKAADERHVILMNHVSGVPPKGA